MDKFDKLDEMLDQIEAPEGNRALSEILYNASEGGRIPEGMEDDEAIRIWKIVQLSTEITSSELKEIII